MKTILITGIDGSGKSTVLSKIKEKYAKRAGVILLPHADSRSVSDPRTAAVLRFINALSHKADQTAVPQLKAVALMSAMLIYRKIAEEKVGFELLFCERHPLLDTPVYAGFYAAKLQPALFPPAVYQPVDEQYAPAIADVVSLLPDGLPAAEQPSVRHIAAFIYNTFFVQKKTDTASLQRIFATPLPDAVYFLKARPDVLFERVRKRKLLEAHEKPEVFEKMDKAYSGRLSILSEQYHLPVTIVNANDTRHLESFFDALEL